MTKKSNDLENIRHSWAHVLAQAVKKIYPDVLLGIGPTIENGFYYDFDNVEIGKNDLSRIQKEMQKIAKQSLDIKKELWPINKAKEYFKKEGANYKLELIDDLIKDEGAKEVGIVFTGDEFVDLCRGGHIKNTKDLNVDAFKLTKVAGAYWRGDEKNPMLTRIYGVAFETKKELDEYLKRMEEAEKRDHKKLGKELGLFTFSPLVGPGLPLFTPKGATMKKLLTDFSEDLKEEAGYVPIHTPHIAKKALYKTSGHLEKFGDDVFYVKGADSEFVLKPMNCPHHTQIYASQSRSYRDLPLLFYETATVYRDEQAGELSGLTRVRSITMDDSHAFCREDQIENVINNLIKGILKVVEAFNLSDYRIDLSLRNEENKKAYLGDDETWENAQKEMESILKKNKVKYEIAEGEAAFYGPKMDLIVSDSLDREWQISTIQLDLNMPSRFKLEYTDKNGNKKTPIMIHSAFLGSLERFMGIIIEHFAGAFPVWLSPTQVWVVPVGDKFNKYGQEIIEKLKENNIRVELRDEAESLGKKIRNGELQRIPYLLIVGEKEKKSKNVSVRDREKGDIGSQKIDKFIEKIKKEIENLK